MGFVESHLAQSQQCGTQLPASFSANMNRVDPPVEERDFWLDFIIIRKSDGTQDPEYSVDISMAYTLMEELNNDFQLSDIQFIMKSCPQYLDNTEIYNSPGMLSIEQWGAADRLLVYLKSGPFQAGAAGIAYPNNQCVVKISSSNEQSEGNILTHEIGHLLGLNHTHLCSTWDMAGCLGGCPELVNGINGALCGDLISDTPADPGIGPNSIAGGLGIAPIALDETCSVVSNPVYDDNGDLYAPLLNNFMCYAPGICRTAFSPGQGEHMRRPLNSNEVLAGCVAHFTEIPSYVDAPLVYTDQLFINTSDIIIENGGILELNSSGGISSIWMKEASRIEVRRGGSLIINGLNITGDNRCSTGYWDGIYVQGDGVQESGNPGVVFLNQVSMFAAEIGLANWIPGNPGDAPNGGRGGVLQAVASNFFNRIDVKMKQFNYADDNGEIPADLSYFTGCFFQQTEFGSLNNQGFPEIFPRVSLNKVHGIRFLDCGFIGLMGSFDESTGVIATNSTFSIISSSHPDAGGNFSGFGGFKVPIKVNNSIYGLPFTISRSLFNDNAHGILMTGVQGARILNNVFESNQVSPENTTAIRATDCSGYIIEENQFWKYDYNPWLPIMNMKNVGIYIENISAPDNNSIYRNYFHDTDHGIVVLGNNSNLDGIEDTGLQILCNRFYSSEYEDADWFTNIALTAGASIRLQQGLSNQSVTGPAGNTFSNFPTCLEEHALYSESGAGFYIYNHHSNEEATPGLGCYTSGPVFPIDAFIVYTSWEDACPANVHEYGFMGENENSNIESKMEEITLVKQEYEELKQTVVEIIDGGNTTNLMDHVADYSYPAHVVKEELLSASPYLSDQVMTLVIEEAERFNPWHFTQVMIANSPLDPRLFQFMDDHTTWLNPYLFNLILDYQDGELSAFGSLRGALSEKSLEKDNLEAAFIRERLGSMDPSKYQYILDMYADEEGNKACKEQVNAYMMIGDYETARGLLNLYENSPLDSYAVLQYHVVNAAESGGYSPADLECIQQIAASDNQASYRARLIMEEELGATYEQEVRLPLLSPKSMDFWKVKRRKVEKELISLFPNPNQGRATIDLSALSHSFDHAMIRLIDAKGTVQMSEELTKGELLKDLQILKQEAGIYYLELSVDDIRLASIEWIKY